MEAFVRPSNLLPSPYPVARKPATPQRPLILLPRRRRRTPLRTVTLVASAPAPSPTPTKAEGFILWGPPGSGKSTLCEALSHSHGLVHISTGSLLRAHVLYETDWGVKAHPYVQASSQVPDDIVIPIVLERLRQVDCAERGFLLDGFPRSLRQYAALSDAGFIYRLAFLLHAPRDTLDRRIRYRRLDPETDLLYNLKLRPTDSQEVLERLVVLDKDRGASPAESFASYGRNTAELFDLLAPNAVRVDADRTFEEIVSDIAVRLEGEGFERLESLDQRPGTRVQPLLATPPNVLGRANAVRERNAGGANDENRPASAAAAMRAQGGPNLDIEEGEEGSKSPITLIRCDGYMCERESVEGSHIAFRGAATEQVMLVWNRRPQKVLLLVKKGAELMSKVLQAVRWLAEENLEVVVEPWMQTEAIANGVYLETFHSANTLCNQVDFVICLGGDGLILHASTLFETAVPPVISFNLGSLGFLTPFEFEDFQAEVSEVMKGNCNLSLRMRLTCGIVRGNQVQEEFHVLNEVVIDRGSSPYLSNLDCYCDGKYITTVQADGIIMSTPTGSTAYSMSAGGSMVHPSVPAILFTPICPHSLSFRPIVFPDSAKLQIQISEDARSHAWASFDGKWRQQLRRGDSLLVEMNLYPVPTVNKTDHTGDWFGSLDRAFNFNSRAMQKSLAPPKPIQRSVAMKNNGTNHGKYEGQDDLSSSSYVDSDGGGSDEDGFARNEGGIESGVPF
eukprot:GFKZ01009072.1.p1 GENE.GFKZ01009072.1~~GFKZ01009072.1.p1  ORF type:complete len:734 (-),score=90.97 GFKZ01009072.1:245-2446(-)